MKAQYENYLYNFGSSPNVKQSYSRALLVIQEIRRMNFIDAANWKKNNIVQTSDGNKYRYCVHLFV